MKKTLMVSNLVWIGLAIAVGVEAMRIGVGAFREPGPAFLPFYAALLLVMLGIIDLVQIWRKTDQKSGESPWAKIHFRKLGIVLASLGVYVAVLNTLGFMISTFLLLLVLFRIMEPYRWTKVLLASLLTIALTYGFFEMLLKSRLPRGLFHF